MSSGFCPSRTNLNDITSPILLTNLSNKVNEEPLSTPIVEASKQVPIIQVLKIKTWKAITSLSVFEKIAFIVAIVIALFTGIELVNTGLEAISTEIPARSGILTEAATDYSRFINPVLARSDVDKDLVTLIYSGLMKPSSNNILVNDLADTVTKSDDGLTYTVKLKNNLKFQDNTALTADDVLFTIQKIKDPAIKSPIAGNWIGIDVKKIDNNTVQFSLPQPYEPFIQNLTIGILPSHLWASSSADTFDINPLNRKPIGSGPYKIDSIKESEPGVVSEYSLAIFDGYISEQPYIIKYVFDMYKDEESAVKAVIDGKADIVSGVSMDVFHGNKDSILKKSMLVTPTLPRTYSLFFNQNNATVLINPEVRTALSQSIDRNDLMQTVRYGYGKVTDSPIPGIMNDDSTTQSGTSSTIINADQKTLTKEARITLAQKTLTDKGWKLGSDGVFVKQTTLNKKTSTSRLTLSISTSNSPELKAIADYVATIWKSVGVEVNVQIYESGDLADKVVRPRKYDVLLFGQIVGRDLDLYPFWHSSQQKDLGLNIAMYANKKVDAALEKLRATSSTQDKKDALQIITSEIENDVPAIFLYSPDYFFFVPKSLHGVSVGSLDSGNERLYTVSQWYTVTKRVLNIFK